MTNGLFTAVSRSCTSTNREVQRPKLGTTGCRAFEPVTVEKRSRSDVLCATLYHLRHWPMCARMRVRLIVPEKCDSFSAASS